MSSHLGETAIRAVANGSGKARDLAHARSCAGCSAEIRMLELLRGATRSGAKGTCPDPLDLIRLAAGQLGEGRERAVQEHLTDCLQCATDFEGLARVEAIRPGRSPLPSPAQVATSVGRGLVAALRRLAVVELPPAVPMVARSAAAPSPHESMLKGLAAIRARKPKEAVRHFERAAEAGRPNGELLFFLGTSLLNAGRADEASQRLAAAVKAEPRRSEYRWQLVQALLCEGRRDEAITALRRLVRMPGTRREAARELLKRIEALD